MIGTRGVMFVAVACACALQASAAEVFLTTFRPPSGQGVYTDLYGFEGTTEVFSVGTTANAFHGVAALGDNVLVADFGDADVIRQFTTDGVELAPFAATLAVFVESDSSSNVYSTTGGLEPGNKTLTRYDSAGAVTLSVTSTSASGLLGIDADSAGNIYVVADSGLGSTPNWIEKYDSAGNLLNSTPVLGTPYDISIDEVGQQLFVAGQNSEIQIFDIGGPAPVLSGTINTPSDWITGGVGFSSDNGTLMVAENGIFTGVAAGYELALDGTVLNSYLPSSAELAFDILVTKSVPEPSTLVLAGLGLLSVVGYRVRRSMSSAC